MNSNTNEEKLFIELFNKLLDCFESNPLRKLDSILNENTLKPFLLEIEPKLEEIGGKLEITADTNIAIRYANLVTVLNVIENYFENYPDKGRFISNGSEIIHKIKINLLLHYDREQLILFSELIILLSAISSKVDVFIDKLTEAEEKYIRFYCGISDKYLVNQDDSIINMSFSRINSEDAKAKSIITKYDRLYRKYEDLAKEKNKFVKTIQDIEKENFLMKENYANSDRKYFELEAKYKDKLRELEYAKSSNKANIEVQEELLQDSMLISQLKNTITQKDMEIVDIKRDHEVEIKSFNEKISFLSERLEIYSDKISGMKSLNSENDKLKAKIKELNILKEKQIEFDQLNFNLESKERMIDTLIKDKQNYIVLLEKGNFDLLNEKEKLRKAEYEKKNLESDLRDLKKEITKYDKYDQMKFKDMQSLNVSVIENKKDGNRLIDLDRSESFFNDIEKTKDERMKLLETEIDDLKKEKFDLKKDVNNLFYEKDKFQSRLEEINLENKRLINEKEKISLDKERLLLKIQKIELDIQRADINNENDRRKLDDELKEHREQIKKIMSENSILLKEKESFEKFINQKDFDKVKQTYEKEIANLKLKMKKSNTINVKEPNSHLNMTNEEINSLKLEIQNSKVINYFSINQLALQQREDFIKTLQNRIKLLEIENENYSQNLKDSVDKFNQDIIKRSEDLEFYKRSYEEQKSRVNKEHELISNSLYELALQFMSLKNELQKKVTANSNN